MDHVLPASSADDLAVMGRLRGLWVVEKAGIASSKGFDPAALMRDLEALVVRQAAREAAQPPPVTSTDVDRLSKVRKAAQALAHALADLRQANGIARPAHYLLSHESADLTVMEETTAALCAAAARAVQAGEKRLCSRGAEPAGGKFVLGELIANDLPAVFRKHFALPCEWAAAEGDTPLVRFIVAALKALDFDLITSAIVMKIQDRSCEGTRP